MNKNNFNKLNHSQWNVTLLLYSFFLEFSMSSVFCKDISLIILDGLFFSKLICGRFEESLLLTV